MGVFFRAPGDGYAMAQRRLGPVVRVLILAVGLAVAGLAVGLLLVLGAAVLLARLGIDLSIGGRIVLSVVLLQGVAFGGTAAVYLRLRGRGLEFIGVAVPDQQEALWVVSGYILAIVGAVAVAAVAVLAGLQPASNRIAELGRAEPAVFLILVPASLLLVGPGEELLFRGLVQGSLREVVGAAPAIVLASAIFALAHVLSLTGDPTARLITVGLLFVPALVLGVAYEATRNIVVPAVIHGAYNATLFALAFLSSIYGNPAVA